MTKFLTGLACASALALTAAHAWAADSDADVRFKAIYSDEWAWRQAQFGDDEDREAPATASLPHVDPVTQQVRLDRWSKVLKALDGISTSALSPDNRVNYAVYRQQIESLAADQRFRTWEAPFNSDSAFWSDLGYMARRRYKTVQAYEAYLGRLNDMPRYFREQIANMKAGMAHGYTVPKVTLVGRDESIAVVARATDPEANPFYAPFKTMPASIPAADQARLKKAAAEAIAKAVVPAHAELYAFMHEDYIPHARTTLAAEALPDGAAFYRSQIKEYTTLDLDPETIHQTGLKEVARIHAEMLDVMAKLGFKGSFPEFLTFLRTDPQFYAKTPDELLMRAAWIAKKVDGKLPQYFGTLPRGRFTIEPVPASIAPYYTAGRGGQSVYLVNTYDLKSRPLYNLTALTLHESAPGHSFQISLASEQKDQPEFRRSGYISAFGEGWALYTEKLGEEMGMYETPYDEFGRLTYEMWRACRLVVDTGVHHKGWTRDQAIAFLRDNTALPEHEIETEVDRYITWPAQALSYKLGELDIVRLRTKAEKELGPKFDIRAFHDAVLSLGSVPLPVLEARIDQFIAAGGKQAASQ